MATTILLAVAIVLAVATIAILVMASAKPDVFAVSRRIGIAAAPETIFPLIEDFRNFTSWSPYERRDPAMKRVFAGPPRGEGAVYEWSGNGKAGAGRMQITQATPPAKVAIDLVFTKPFKARNVVNFTLERSGSTTDVTWSMRGPTPFVAKIMHVLVDMDRMIGRDFERGLGKLKAIAEGERREGPLPRPPAAAG